MELDRHTYVSSLQLVRTSSSITAGWSPVSLVSLETLTWYISQGQRGWGLRLWA